MFGGKGFLELFWVFILQIFRSKSNIVVYEITQNLKTSTNVPIGYKMKKYRYKNYGF